MPRFREASTGTRVENRAGGEAYSQSPKLALVSLLLTSFVSDKYYESADGQLERLSDYVSDVPDKRFVAKAAIYARTEYGMRSITHALAGELVRNVKGEAWVKGAIGRIVYRPDDMLEILGYYLGKYGKPLPNSLKKGLASAVGKFDSYQLAKYRGSRSNVKMVDLFNLVHPKPAEGDGELYKSLMTGALRSSGTWESELTKAGQEAAQVEDAGERAEKLKELKSDKWTDLVHSGKIGYFALLRNLRNIFTDAPDVAGEALRLLCDERRIRKSLVLPFRYITALSALGDALPFDHVPTTDIVSAINHAVEISLANVPELPGETLVVLDESGSMAGKPIEIGSLFAAILFKRNRCDLMSFSDSARMRMLNADDSVLTLATQLCQNAVMSGTNFHSIFTGLTKPYDRIVILSDMQGWMGYHAPTQTFASYRSRTGADSFIYSFDLNGYGDMQFPQRQVFCIAGFSEKVFDIFKALETDKDALIAKIDAIEL